MKPDIVIVGEFWRADEADENKSFAGSRGWILRNALAQAGIESARCVTTSVVKEEIGSVQNLFGPKLSSIPLYPSIKSGKHFKAEYAHHVERLHEEIDRVKPNIIIALGDIALWALCKRVGIKKVRGTPLLTHDGKYKVMPTWNPIQVIQKWAVRPILISDLQKALREAAFPEIRRPSRELWLNPTMPDIYEFWEKHIKPARRLSCDIETKGETITEVGYATSENMAIVIPFYTRLTESGNYWPTFEEEREAWNIVREINATKPLLGQNFSYDMQYFWRSVGIPCPHFAGDTMLMHHALQPEMEKSLGFLGSIYTEEPSWKFMRTDHSTFKAED